MSQKNFIWLIFASTLVFVTFSCKERGAQNAELSAASEDKAKAALTKVNGLIGLYRSAVSDEKRKEVRTNAWDFVADLDAKGELDGLIALMINIPPQTKSMPAKDKEALAKQVYGFIKTEVDNRPQFPTWESMDNRLMARVNAQTDPDLITVLEKLGGSSFQNLTDYRLLIDGPASWTLRKQLVDKAKQNIWIFTWAFYNDFTGNDAVDWLVEKKAKNPGIDIRVVVDGPIGSKAGHTEVVDRLIAAGIQIIRWDRPRYVGYGMHRKIFLIDHDSSQSAAIFGGMNFGDNYSHNPKKTDYGPLDKWRDTDMVVYGNPVKQAARIFAERWNQFNAAGGTLVSTPNRQDAAVPAELTAEPGSERFAFVDQNPSSIAEDRNYLDPVLLVTLKMIESAKSEIEMSNAYYIVTYPIQEALVRAMKRGVLVRVHTNSDSSLAAEDKALIGPIYKSLAKLFTSTPGITLAKPPKAYLHTASTLHSKYMVVDRKFGWIGSYNIHPRSARYEGESVGVFHGTKIGGEVHAMFDADAKSSTEVSTVAAVTLPESALFDSL